VEKCNLNVDKIFFKTEKNASIFFGLVIHFRLESRYLKQIPMAILVGTDASEIFGGTVDSDIFYGLGGNDNINISTLVLHLHLMAVKTLYLEMLDSIHFILELLVVEVTEVKIMTFCMEQMV
jgi:hypothetical protein